MQGRSNYIYYVVTLLWVLEAGVVSSLAFFETLRDLYDSVAPHQSHQNYRVLVPHNLQTVLLIHTQNFNIEIRILQFQKGAKGKKFKP